ncbi:putative C6 transcription factor [Xylariaceae sp. FL0016]|nr:putative C6 transcription factor [Xylariaceae sp. FL0016]
MSATSTRLPPILSPPPTIGPELSRTTPNPRKRGRTACTRCKNRKQKCDDQWPICSNCRKAGTECDKTAVTEDEPPAAYTRALEERVAFLETRLSDLGHQQQTQQVSPVSSEAPRIAGSNVLGEVVELLSLGNFEAPAYVGASSGLNLALNLGEMVQATVWNKAMPRAGEGTGSSRAEGDSLHTSRRRSSRAITMEEVVANSADPPDDELGGAILNAYFNQLHARYPFLDPDEVWRLHAKRMILKATPVHQLTKSERFGLFKLYMLYAIGAMLLQLTEKHTTSTPESYYMAALQHVVAARESRTTQNIEAMAILVLYHLRSASSHGIWYMIGLAMRTCIDLGLHAKRNENGLDPFTIQMRRRLFWSVYSLERVIAISLGRPQSIPDRQIDVDLPQDDHSRRDSSRRDSGAPSPASPPATPTISRRPSLSLAISLFELRRIESRIQHAIYRVDRPLAALVPKLDRLYAELEAWRAALQDRFAGAADAAAELNYPMLHYHRAVRLLVQPFLAVLPAGDPYYLVCMRAAGDICQAHKRLHQSLDYGHSFIAVQTVFVAGITLLYGLWTQQHAVWSVALSNDIRACSLVLFVMGERAPWVRKYRDAFELLVNATMEKLQNGVSRLAETAAEQMRAVANGGAGGVGGAKTTTTTTTTTASASEIFENAGDGEDGDAWRVVAELASWIDQPEGSPVWMPEFDLLQNLSP